MSEKDESSGKDGGGGIPVSNLMSQALRELRLPENESQVSNAPVSTPALSARTEQDPSSNSVGSSDAQAVVNSYEAAQMGSSNEPDTYYDDNDEHYDPEQQISVLHPDHPLMARFQNRLRTLLTERHTKIDLELRELTEDSKKHKNEREELGVNLYEVQQELGRQQANLEEQHMTMAKEGQQRKTTESHLEQFRQMFNQKMNLISAGMKRNQELQTENEAAAGRLFAIVHSKEDTRGDIQVMRRTAEKADSELTAAELEKQRQDMLVNRLEERADQLRQEINMYKMQSRAQESETKAIRSQICEAKTEIETIEFEKKQLYQQWNTTLIGLRRRDDALLIAKEVLSENTKKVRNLDTEIEGYKQSVQDEEDTNEKNTVLLNRVEHDIEQAKRKIDEAKKEQAQLQQKQASYLRILAENEQTLVRSNAELAQHESSIEQIRTILEKEAAERLQLEHQLGGELRDKMGHEKAASFAEKLTASLSGRQAAVQMEVTKLSNQAARDTLKIAETDARCWEARERLKELNQKIEDLNKVISETEMAITRMHAMIERKQTTQDQMNKKLDTLVSTTGGEELGPLEIEISSLNKTLDQLNNEINEIEIFWLRQQHELVKLSQEKDQRNKEIKVLTKKITILEQKKLRVENEIDGHNQEFKEVERNIQQLRNQLDKVNTLLNVEANTQDKLEQDNKLQEVEFIAELRELEHVILVEQERLEHINHEKCRLQNELIETERLILLWERKIQLARETIAAVDSEVGQGEIKSMRSEIHRMELKFKELMLAQEALMKEMEYSVCRRENINNRTKPSTAPTKGNLMKKIQDSKRNIRQLKNSIQQADEAITHKRTRQHELSNHLQECQVTISEIESRHTEVGSQLADMKNKKDVNLQELVTKQGQAKEYQKVMDKKYKPLTRDNEVVKNELDKMSEKLNSIRSVVHGLQDEFPNHHHQVELNKASDMLNIQQRL